MICCKKLCISKNQLAEASSVMLMCKNETKNMDKQEVKKFLFAKINFQTSHNQETKYSTKVSLFDKINVYSTRIKVGITVMSTKTHQIQPI